MKILIPFLILFSLTSCSLKEAVDGDFKTETSVEPMAPSKTLAERFGDGENVKFTLKIPLTEDSVGYYDIEDVLGNRNLDSAQKTFMQSMYDAFKLKMFNTFVGLGYSNKLLFSSVFSFPKIDSRFIKSARVKKIFFTTEDCRPGEDNCNDRTSLGSNFNLVDTFFVNISSVRANEAEGSGLQELSSEEFLKAKEYAFKQTSEKREQNVNKAAEFASPEDDREINLVKFANTVPIIDIATAETLKNGKLRFNIHNNKSTIAEYLRGDKFRHLISRVRYGNAWKHPKTRRLRKVKGIEVTLKDDASTDDVLDIILGEHTPYAQRMFIFRLNSKFVEAKKFFKADRFKGIVRDSTMIGKSLYVEVSSDENISVFEDLLKTERSNFIAKLDDYQVDRCVRANCLDLKVSDVNLVPLIERDPNIKIDTYLSVKTLGASDFKYNGFIEVEILLDVPL